MITPNILKIAITLMKRAPITGAESEEVADAIGRLMHALQNMERRPTKEILPDGEYENTD